METRTREPYQYPDHYEFEAFVHALKVANEPSHLHYRWPFNLLVRWLDSRKDGR